MMDSITEEIREIRHALAEQCENDIDRIFERLQKTACSSGRNYVSLPLRTASTKAVAEQDGPAERSTVR
jgi:hypothetical protein